MATLSNREYITAISIESGIIMLIKPDGDIGFYRQRSIDTLTASEINKEISAGRLSSQWKSYQELPKNYSISFEDPQIMGRAIATYPLVLKKNRLAKKSKD